MVETTINIHSEMYQNLTVLLSVFGLLVVNGLDLECSVDTIEQLYASSERNCDLCEILRSKLEVSHCQSDNPPCISNNSPHHHPSINTYHSLLNKTKHKNHKSIQWDRTTFLNNGNSDSKTEQPIYHALIKSKGSSSREEDEGEDADNVNKEEYLFLSFNSYPKILPGICEQRRHPVQSPFGHNCSPNTECKEDESADEGYVCECQDDCSRTWMLRKILESFQIICIVFSALLCLLVYWLRKSKVMSVSMWPITESILFGGILLYSSVILKIEIPTAMFCLMGPWLREIGFTLFFGGITLKVYRSLVEFRTRKAHRWVVREKDILRYLGTMTCVILFYMTSWTVTNKYYSGEDWEEFNDILSLKAKHLLILDQTFSISFNLSQHKIAFKESFSIDHLYCPVTWWHRCTEAGEVLFLCVGLNMSWHLRRAPVSPFKNFYAAALLIEISTNVSGIIIREARHLIVGEEDEVFLMLLTFIRCQLTTTIILFLIVAPKLYYIREEKRKRQLRRGETTSGGICAGRKALEAAINNGDLDFADINLADMDPQDIRLELKRVYTQLELLRNKTMRKDNPHISKRRGGRKPTHRRFSLQALRRQQQQQQQHYQQQQSQRSFRGYPHDDIEDSVCSIEGPSTYSQQ